MYKAIHHDGYKSLVDVSEYLARHDIVYRRPALKPYEGLPVGDGKMGGLLYHEPNGIAMQVNHTDAIDFAPDGNMQAWSWETEERNTAPVACAVISIQSSLPCFDWQMVVCMGGRSRPLHASSGKYLHRRTPG